MPEMQTIPYSGLMIRPGSETDGYDEQKDMIERGARKIHALYAKNGRQDITVVRAIPTEEKGTLFTVFIDGGSMEFGLYSDGAIRQEMVYGNPLTPLLEHSILTGCAAGWKMTCRAI